MKSPPGTSETQHLSPKTEKPVSGSFCAPEDEIAIVVSYYAGLIRGWLGTFQQQQAENWAEYRWFLQMVVMVVMKRSIWVPQSRFIAVCLLSAVALCAAAAAQAQLVSVDEIEARVRQVYFEGYPVTDRDPLGPAAVERLGEMLRDPADEPYWANIVLALGASENSDAYRHLADFAANGPEGEASSPVYQARVSLPVALGNLAHRHPSALGLLEEMARDARLEPGWSFQSLEGASLAGALRRSAITGLAVSGRPEAAAVLTDLASRAAAESAESAELDELRQHLAFAQTLHRRAASQGPASVLGRRPVAK